MTTFGVNVPVLKREIMFNFFKIRTHSLAVMYRFIKHDTGTKILDYSDSPLLFKPNISDCSINFINSCFGSNSSSSKRYSLRSSGVSSFLV